MLQPQTYLNFLEESGVRFYSGVPDSLLKNFCDYLSQTLPVERHVIAANEGGAMGLAVGHYLGTGSLPCVYLQNSGLGNLVNPLLSISSPDVYGIPMLLMVGWRGEPGVTDEPQHLHQGRITKTLMELMGVPTFLLSTSFVEAKKQTIEAIRLARESNCPVALLVQKNTFEKAHVSPPDIRISGMRREEALQFVVGNVNPAAVVVATTGMVSRELFEYRCSVGGGHEKDFLTVGGMGHASQIALGLALSRKNRLTYCLDGDGAILMHMGSLAIVGQSSASNLVHVVLNNGVHDSVGGQPTVGLDVSLAGIAHKCGYQDVFVATTKEEIEFALNFSGSKLGPRFIEIRVIPGSRSDIGRPNISPSLNKQLLMQYLEEQR